MTEQTDKQRLALIVAAKASLREAVLRNKRCKLFAINGFRFDKHDDSQIVFRATASDLNALSGFYSPARAIRKLESASLALTISLYFSMSRSMVTLRSDVLNKLIS